MFCTTGHGQRHLNVLYSFIFLGGGCVFLEITLVELEFKEMKRLQFDHKLLESSLIAQSRTYFCRRGIQQVK